MSCHTSGGVAAVLNVCFGNSTELIVSIIALKKGLLRVVQLSLLGSFMSNCLLVLGFSLLLGGVKFKHQTFDSSAAALNVQMLMLSARPPSPFPSA